jgi:hypothetical protein
MKVLTSKEEYTAEYSLYDRNDHSPMNDELAELCRPLVAIPTMPQE